MTRLRLTTLLAILALSGCEDAGERVIPQASVCIGQEVPFYPNLPYLGIHAGPANNDLVPCQTADSYRLAWQALPGHRVGQPNTFSADGKVTYVTTQPPRGDTSNTLFAIDVASGRVIWSQAYPSAVASSVEVDRTGKLYLTAGVFVVSLEANGQERWRTGIDSPGFGLHFTPQGEIATVSNSGTVYLLAMETGEVLQKISLPEIYGFVPGQAGVGGGFTAGVGGGFTGVSGNFSDNTLGIAPNGDIYVIGGGPDPDHGALIQLRRGPNGLEAGWYAVTQGGSATSPAISPEGRYVVVGDGSGTKTGRLLWADTEKCPESGRCQWAQAIELSGAPILGSPAVLPGGEVIFWELGADKTRDLARVSPQGHFIWETDLGGNLDWTSVVTVSQNHVIGTASELSYGLLGIPRPGPDFLVLLERESGKFLAKFPLSDDSFATVSVGPNGDLYVGMLGVLSLNQRQAGLAKFVPN